MSIDSDTPNHDTSTENENIPNKDPRRLSKSIEESEKRQRTSSDSMQPQTARNLSTMAWISVVISLLFSMFLFSLDNVIVADIQPRIIETLGHVDELPWVSVAYALGGSAVNLSVAKLFSSFNNKLLFISGVVVFEVGSAICGAAPSMTALIFGRVICGVGAVGIYVGNMNLLSVLTTEAERPLYLSFVGLTWGLGTVLGPVIGGAFSDGPPTWRWSFYFNLCVGAVAAPIYIFLLPSYNPRPGISFSVRIREIDVAGSVLFAGAYVCLVMAIAFGGSVYAWSSTQIIVFFVVAGVLWVTFVIQQALAIFTTKENRLVPISILRSWEMQILFAQIAAAVTVVYVPMYFIPLYFQFVQGDSALHAAVRLLPFVFANVFGIIFNGAVMGKMGYYMPWYLIGGVLSVAGGTLLTATVGVDTSPSAIYGYSVLCGLGSGLFVQASFAVAQLKVVPVAIPLTVAFLGCGQITGITLALTVSHSIFLNQATDRIARILPMMPRDTVQQAITGVDSSFFNTLAPSDRARVLDAIVQSISRVYPMVIAGGAVAVVLALLMKRERIFGQPLPTGNEGEKTAF